MTTEPEEFVPITMISKPSVVSIPNQSLDTRRLTQEELKERSAKGLYYDEKWSMEHRCKQ
ncbi:unnamed protein product, partial [Musa acuminata subsp. burmannicoides]